MRDRKISVTAFRDVTHDMETLSIIIHGELNEAFDLKNQEIKSMRKELRRHIVCQGARDRREQMARMRRKK